MNRLLLSPPAGVYTVIKKLTDVHYEAYYVGGCVRDSLRGVVPCDWDITTSALPEQIQACFPTYTAVTSGIAHGTVGIVTDDGMVEITTFRVDGNYSDVRHPDCVYFARNLHEDLARRDFTVNALAADINGAVTDDFNGMADLSRGLLRCVGNPEKRFHEDALRILRALRFSATLAFEVESETAAAIRVCFSLLNALPRERIRGEIDRMLHGSNAAEVLEDWKEQLLPYLPLPCDQHAVLKLLKRYGDGMARKLTAYAENAPLCGFLESYISEQAQLPLSSLAINGNDLLELGLQGAEIGKALQSLLIAVRENAVPNEKPPLVDYFRQHRQDW